MLELGAYWGHYSMWLKHVRPRSKVSLVEPIKKNIAIGRANFNRNGYEGDFIRSFVSRKHFTVDQFLRERGYPRLDILHSDIQGYEVEMLDGCVDSFHRRLIDYVFVSTHSETLHHQVVAALTDARMRVCISSACKEETTSYDGFVFAVRAELPEMFANFRPLGRREILKSDPEKLVDLSLHDCQRTQTCNCIQGSMKMFAGEKVGCQTARPELDDVFRAKITESLRLCCGVSCHHGSDT